MINFDQLRGTAKPQTGKSARKTLKELGVAVSLTALMLFGSAQKSQAQTQDNVKSDRNSELVMKKAAYLADAVKELPEMESVTKHNINETGRSVTDHSNRWHSVSEYSKDGKPVETIVTSVYDNDKVATFVIDYEDNRLEDKKGNPLSAQEAEAAIRGTEQSIFDTNRQIKGLDYAKTEREKHSKTLGTSLNMPTRQNIK